MPPASGTGDWEPYAVAWTKAFAQANLMNQEPNPATLDMNEIIVGYGKKDASAFNKAVASYEVGAGRPPAGGPRYSQNRLRGLLQPRPALLLGLVDVRGGVRAGRDWLARLVSAA